MRACIIVCTVSLASACAPGVSPGPGASAPSLAEAPALSVSSTPQIETNDPRFQRDLLRIARVYEILQHADGTWSAPFDCIAPSYTSYVSSAKSGGHGRKIYALFVKDLVSYAALSGTRVDNARVSQHPALAALPQVIVKEAWTSVPYGTARSRCKSSTMAKYLTSVKVNGEEHVACEPAGLFVMYRAPAGSEGTDDGWVYGTIQYDSSTPILLGTNVITPYVTSAGRVGSCMRCHDRAPHGRLFGMQPTP